MAKKTKKAVSGDGSFRERPDGRWECRISWYNPQTGKTERKSFFGKTQKEVKQKRDEFLKAVREGRYVAPSSTHFQDYARKWLDLYIKPKVRQTTYMKYLNALQTHINPVLGEIPIQKLTADMIQAFYNEKAQTKASSTVALLHQVVSGCLKHAVRQGIILSNPAELTTRPKVKYKEVPPFTPDELRRFFEAAQGDPFYPLYVLAAYTGLRRGELLALRWSDIDFKTGILTVQQSMNRVGKPDGGTEIIFSAPKTANSKREIPLLPAAIRLLKEQKVKQNKDKLFLGKGYTDLDLVFAMPTGKPIEPKYFLARTKKILKKAGLREEIHIHTFRHTFGTMLAQAGENPKNIQTLLGHADVRTVLNIYVHTAISDKKRAVEKMSALLDELI